MKNGSSVRCYITKNPIPFDESVFGQLLGWDEMAWTECAVAMKRMPTKQQDVKKIFK